jgi:hypothetical protein
MSDDIVARLRDVEGGYGFRAICREAADEIERLRNELAARCGDGGAGAHTAGPTEHFIPEAL